MTDTSRTLESAKQFAIGLFGQAAVHDNQVEFITEEKLLKVSRLDIKQKIEKNVPSRPHATYVCKINRFLTAKHCIIREKLNKNR